MKKLLLLAATITLLSGCGPSQKEYDQARKHVADLEAQVAVLRAELEEVKFGAGRLLAQAKSAYEAKNDAEAKSLLSDLLKRHPSSPESVEASSLLAQVEARIAAVEQQRRQEEERRAREERVALERAVGSMKKTNDEIKGITWIEHRKTPILGKYVSLYFGTTNNSAENYPVRMKIQFFGSRWLFARSVTVKADDKVYNLGNLDFKRDNSSNSVWEWVDMPVSDHEMLKNWMAAKRVVVRFMGDPNTDDFVLPQDQQAQLREVYQAWKVMGGKP